MKQTTTESYDLDEYIFDCIALRRQLGITSNRMTAEQRKICNEAERELWYEKFPNSISSNPPPSPKRKSDTQS
jgi:hypothetical protein